MKKYLAKMLRRAAQKLDPQDAPLFTFQLPGDEPYTSSTTGQTFKTFKVVP